MPHYSWRQDTLLVYCHIQPNAAHNAIVGLYNERLKIRISAAATEGAANSCLVKFLAAQFGVVKSRVELIKGLTSRQKTVAITMPKKLPQQASIARA